MIVIVSVALLCAVLLTVNSYENLKFANQRKGIGVTGVNLSFAEKFIYTKVNALALTVFALQLVEIFTFNLTIQIVMLVLGGLITGVIALKYSSIEEKFEVST